MDRFDGLTNEQIAREYKWISQKYGDHSHEVGELRKKVTELEKTKETPDEKPVTRRGLTAPEIEDFNSMYETDPVGAVLKYGSSDFQEMIDKRVEEKLQSTLPERLSNITEEQADAVSFRNFQSSHDDADDYTEAMKTLDDPRYLGSQKRDYEELYDLVKLAGTDNKQYQQVYNLMKKHPTMAYKEAISFTGTVTSKTPRQQVVNEVTKIKSANSTSTTKARSDTGTPAKTMDEAFALE